MNQVQDAPEESILSPEEVSKKIAGLILPYRKLKADTAAIKEEMDQIKSRIEPLIKMIGGNWKDDLGYAKQNTRADSVSYKSEDVDKLVQSWLISQESLIRTCGEMMEVHRTERKGTTYLQVK